MSKNARSNTSVIVVAGGVTELKRAFLSILIYVCKQKTNTISYKSKRCRKYRDWWQIGTRSNSSNLDNLQNRK